MNSLIDRGQSNLNRIGDVVMRLADFRHKLLGSLPPQPTDAKSAPSITPTSDIFMERSHDIFNSIEERIRDLENNVNHLETFFINSARGEPAAGRY